MSLIHDEDMALAASSSPNRNKQTRTTNTASSRVSTTLKLQSRKQQPSTPILRKLASSTPSRQLSPTSSVNTSFELDDELDFDEFELGTGNGASTANTSARTTTTAIAKSAESDAHNTDLAMETKSPAHIKSLLENVKKVVVKVQDLVQQSSQEIEFYDNGQLPSYDNLVRKLGTAFQRQAHINKATSQIISVNYMVNIANFLQNRTLSKSLAKGKKQILELQREVQSLEEAVDGLNVDVDVQKETASRLKESLEATKGLLENTIKEHRKELGKHKSILEKQQEFVKDIYKSKFNQDFVVDGGLFFVALYTVNSILVDYPLRAILSIFMNKPSQKRTFIRQLFKTVLLTIIMARIRNLVAEYGFHNRVGALMPYFTSVLTLVQSTVEAAVTKYRGQIVDHSMADAPETVLDIVMEHVQENEARHHQETIIEIPVNSNV